MHGYQLHEFIDRYLDMCVDLKKSTAYYLLDKIAKEGLVTQSEEREGNRPPRRVYRLTPSGEVRFQELLHQNLVEYLPVHFGGLVGLAFLDEMEVGEARSLLIRRRQALIRALEQVRATPPHPGTAVNAAPRSIVRRMKRRSSMARSPRATGSEVRSSGGLLCMHNNVGRSTETSSTLYHEACYHCRAPHRTSPWERPKRSANRGPVAARHLAATQGSHLLEHAPGG